MQKPGVDTPPVQSLEVDATLRWVVVFFRALAWAWMLALVVEGLVNDDDIRSEVAIGAMALATIWLAVTLWAARTRILGTTSFVVADGVVALLIGAASTVGSADSLFHGGMPMSWIVVAAYALGLRGSLLVSLILAGEQIIVHIVDDRGAAGALGSLVFPVFALALGSAFDRLRRSERLRVDAELKLIEEQRERARHEERADLANRLHDSVLQTLHVIRRDAENPDQVRYLARLQERQLRRTIDEFRSPHKRSFRAALLGAADEIEDTYRIRVDVVIRDDIEMDDQLVAVIDAAKEALTNSAKHSGADHIDVYAEAGPDGVNVYVRDRGVGFVPGASEGVGGVAHSLMGRVAAAGGDVRIASVVGEGTEIVISIGTGA